MSDGKLLQGQEYDKRYSHLWPFTQQMRDIPGAAEQLGDGSTEVNPVDANASLVKVYDLEAIQAQLDAFKLVFPGKINLNLPAELKSISVVTESQAADGSNNPMGDAAFTGTGFYQASLGSTSEVQASGASMSDLVFHWSEGTGENKLCTYFSCFVKIPTDGILTRAAVLAKIKTLNSAWSTLSLDWPKFNPVAHTVVITGTSASIRVSAMADSFQRHEDTADLTTVKSDVSKMMSRQVTVKSVNIPPCIHGAITIANAQPATTTIKANASNEVTGSIVPNVSAASGDVTATIGSKIEPLNLAATTGQATIPTTGCYVRELTVDVYNFGYAAVSGVVFDFADL